ncbi:Dabb family protein [Micropruina sp.]|uniref:Dabb family protein n=1 Tax=Micropruina sp. TaxID=2737536 RepID=UPI0039E4F930
MIKHIVAWNFADQAEGTDRATNVAQAATALRELPDLVPGIVEFEVVEAQDGLDNSFDLALYSVFTDTDALHAYAVHPDHLKVVTFIRARVTGRSVIDYDPTVL